MIPTIRFSTSEASSAQIARHLARADAQFNPPLSSRVDLAAYAEKIFQNASRMEAWADTELVGLVATYCNDPERIAAYITNVSVLADWTGKGLGLDLLKRSVSHTHSCGLLQIQLEVARANAAAVHLYEKAGFCARDVNGSVFTMTRTVA